MGYSQNRWHGARNLTVALAALTFASCGSSGPALYPVRGQVFVRGQPTEGAVVVFHPVGDTALGGPKPTARVGADGSFVLGTHSLADGAPAGKYQVAIAWLGDVTKPNRVTGEVPVKLSTIYADPRTSGLSAEVTEGPNEIPAFRLTK
jgi:hypothetical protein